MKFYNRLLRGNEKEVATKRTYVMYRNNCPQNSTSKSSFS